MSRNKNRQYDQSETKPSRCKKCGSTRRAAYFGEPQIRVFTWVQVRTDGTEFTRLIRRRTHCKDCGQFRYDLAYDYFPEDLPGGLPETPEKKSADPTQRKRPKRKPVQTVAAPQSVPEFLGAAEAAK